MYLTNAYIMHMLSTFTLNHLIQSRKQIIHEVILSGTYARFCGQCYIRLHSITCKWWLITNTLICVLNFSGVFKVYISDIGKSLPAYQLTRSYLTVCLRMSLDMIIRSSKVVVSHVLCSISHVFYLIWPLSLTTLQTHVEQLWHRILKACNSNTKICFV